MEFTQVVEDVYKRQILGKLPGALLITNIGTNAPVSYTHLSGSGR